MLLASTNCVGAVWCVELFIINLLVVVVMELVSRHRIGYERQGCARAIDVILHRGRPAQPDRPDNFSIHLNGKGCMYACVRPPIPCRDVWSLLRLGPHLTSASMLPCRHEFLVVAGLAFPFNCSSPQAAAVDPADIQKHRSLVRYVAIAQGINGGTTRLPLATNACPNFAWFVYDGIPPWTGASKPGSTPPITFSARFLTTLPVYHLIARAGDVERSQWDAASNRKPFFGTLVYDGRVY